MILIGVNFVGDEHVGNVDFNCVGDGQDVDEVDCESCTLLGVKVTVTVSVIMMVKR